VVRRATAEGDWPRTTRALPWLLAAFLVALFLTPVDAIQLPVTLPFDSKLDRFFVGVLVLVWLGSKLLRRSARPGDRHSTLVHAGTFLVVAAALTSILVNVDALTKLAEYDQAVKHLGLLVAYVLFFCVVASVVRPGELRAFMTLMVVLASLTAVGTIYEYHSDINVFFKWTESLLPAGIHVNVAEHGIDSSGRQGTTGPTQHGLAVATLLSLAIPFAIVGLLRARGFIPKLLYVAATWVILAGALATQRKSAVFIPLTIVLVLLAYRPQRMLQLVPVLVVMVAAVPILSPRALDTIGQHLAPNSNGLLPGDNSTKGRTEDYDAIKPDVRSHMAFGRGFGSYDSRTYRFLDNQYLRLLVATGILGVAAYLLMVVAVLAVAHPVIKSRDPIRGPPALAIAAAVAGFGVATAFYDVLSFAQVPYFFFFLAGLAVVCAPRANEARVPASQRAEGPRAEAVTA
jgi:O-antigen ligase